MRRFAFCLSVGLIAGVLVGCGGGETDEETGYVPTPGEETTSEPGVSVVGTSNHLESSPAASSAAIPENATPTQIVQAYLDALSAEDYRLAEDLLTQSARDAFFQAQLQPSLPGPIDAKFEIEGIRFATQKKERGYVATTWTEMSEGGQPIVYTVDIYVRQEVPDVWRVAGMMMDVSEDQFVFFNFEDAADMISKNSGADTSQPEIRQATDPGEGVIR